MDADCLVVGAGVAGLACASGLARSGTRVLVLEKSRGVGGRCATRRIGSEPVDFGLVFLHGSDRRFVGAVESVSGATLLPGWPRRIHGSGHPCQPGAFAPGETRWAFAEGLTAFPKHLAAGLDIRRGIRVTGLAEEGRNLRLELENAASLVAGCVVVALPVEQARGLLGTLPSPPAGLQSSLALLQMVGSLPCLTVMAGYPNSCPAPAWDVCYPEDSPILQLIAHDSAKRENPEGRILVLQARPAWSQAHLENGPEAWSAALLGEARRLAGDWAGSPEWVQGHRWRFSRVDRGCEFSGPMLLEFPGGARLGLAGEVFFPGGGVQAAFLSGLRLAERLAGG